MNRMKKTGALLLAVILCAVILAACGGQEPGQESANTGEASYRVTVMDALGNPCSEGVIVRFLQNGEQAAMQVADENGVAEKSLPKGDYTVELMFTDSEIGHYYDQTNLSLSADQTELEITLAQTVSGEAVPLYVQGEERSAYYVNAGSTYVALTAGERNFFLFTPTVAGTYEVSATGDVEQIGYYGAPHFVQEFSAAEVVDGKFTISISAGMIGTGDGGTTVLVLGIDPGSAQNCMLNVIRTGDPEYSMDDEPWTYYQTTAELAPYTLPAGAKLEDFELTASTDTYHLVLNTADGFYHLDSADGPLVLARLGKDGKYTDCFKTMMERANICKYFFDENGEFLKKESYNDCLTEYINNMDENEGVYPLTEDLKYIIQQRGEYAEWWDPDGHFYLFVDENGMDIPGINQDIAWLFMCCYIAN